MADELILMAEPREIHGKKVKRLRREGLIPGVVYGPVVQETVSVSVDSRIFNKFFTAHGHSTIFTLKWDGGDQPVLVREVQRDPVRQDILHIDFFAPNMTMMLRQTIALNLHNVPDDYEEGGILQSLLTEIEVEALPANLPSEIVVDISSLKAIGDTLHVSDIEAPADVTIITDPDTAVATVSRQAVEEAPEGEEGELLEDEESEEAAEDVPATEQEQ